jgi:hypothetical protein
MLDDYGFDRQRAFVRALEEGSISGCVSEPSAR